MRESKVAFLVFLCVISLCAVAAQPVKSQDINTVYILNDGSVYSSTNATVPIQQDGNVYTFTDDILAYSFVIQRSNIIIDGKGFTIAGEGNIGIDLMSMSNVTIKDVQLSGGFYYGIYLLESSDITLTGNTIENSGSGIFIYNSTQNTISGNSITKNGIGIELRSAPDNIFRDNSLDNGYNFAVYGSELSHFINDIDVSNTINGKKVYYLINQNGLVISPDTFPDVGFIALVSCTNITVHNLELSNNGQGVVLAFTTGSTIAQNSITNNYNGILLFRSSSNLVVSNSIANNYRGIQFSNSSNSNSISENNISNNTNGLFLFESSQNAISGNNITDNDTGIGFRASSSNRILSNYFVNNAIQVYDYHMGNSSIMPSLNFWSIAYQLGGNYWSDYTGVDVKSGSNQNQTGSDGIGDTSYTIYASNKDDFPLMPYGSPPAISIVSPENKTYTTTDVTLDFTVSEATSWIKYSLDGQANVTITGSTTLSGLADGLHSITVYAQDTDGLTGISETIYFTISEGAEPTQSESFPITWIAAAIAVVVVVGVALLYFLKIKKK